MNNSPTTPWGSVMNAANGSGPEDVAQPSGSQESITGPTPVIQQQITPEMVAGGYQIGTSPQTLMVGDEGKGPKVPMIIAAIFVGIGLLGFVIGGVSGAAFEEAVTNLSTEDYTFELDTSDPLVYNDADGSGDAGWYLLISGDPKADVNENNVPDACEDLGQLSIVDANGEDISNRVASLECSEEWDYFDIKDHVIVGLVCSSGQKDTEGTETLHNCMEGEELYVSGENTSFQVVDLDEMYLDFISESGLTIALAGGSFIGGCCSICGGMIALIVGLMRLGGGKKGQQVQYQIN
jgi:hypothetical protein